MSLKTRTSGEVPEQAKFEGYLPNGQDGIQIFFEPCWMLPCFALFPTDLQGKEGLLAVYSQSESSNFFRSIISKLIRQNTQAMQLNAAYMLFRFQFIICQILTRRAR